MKKPTPEKIPLMVKQVTNIPKYYFNGFSLGLSNSDITMMLTINGNPEAELNMSYTTAKSLSDVLNITIKHLETSTGHELMTTKFIEKKLNAADEKAKKNA